MKKVFSIFLVFTNLFLSKSFVCLAEPNEKVTSKKVVTLEKKKKKAEEQKKVEEYDEVEDGTEDPKKNSISIEISDETIEKIKEMLNSETNENYAKARLTIDAIFSVILGVNLLCSLKERFFPSTEPIVDEKVHVVDENKIPIDFLIEQRPKIDVASLRKFLKSGGTTPGSVLEQTEYVRAR